MNRNLPCTRLDAARRKLSCIGLALTTAAAGCSQDIRILDTGTTPSGRDGSAATGDTLPGDGGADLDGGLQDSGVEANCIGQPGDVVQVPDPGGADRFQGVRSIAFDSDGRLYVLNIRGPAPFVSYVQVFSQAPQHRLEGVIGRNDLGPVQHMSVAPDGRVIVVEFDTSMQGGPPAIVELDRQGTLLRRWSPDRSPNAYSAAVDVDGNYFIGGFIVRRYDSSRVWVGEIGEEGGALGQMEIATDTEVGPNGSVWVADLFRNNIHQWDATTGRHVLEFGGKGNGEPGKFDNGNVAMGDFFGPGSIAFDSNGDIYADDSANSRIQKLSATGTHRATFDFGGSQTLGPLAVEPRNGNVYVGRRTSIDIICPL